MLTLCGCVTQSDVVSDSNLKCFELITNLREIEEYLDFEGIDYDSIWIPPLIDINALRSSLKTHLLKNPAQPDEFWLQDDFILQHLQEYCIEYSGFVRGGKNFIVSNIVLYHPWWLADNRFSIICDGGCWVLSVVFDAKDMSVIRFACHPEA